MKEQQANLYARAIKLVGSTTAGFILVETTDNDERMVINPLCFSEEVRAKRDVGSTDETEWMVEFVYRLPGKQWAYQLMGIYRVTVRESDRTVFIYTKTISGKRFVLGMRAHVDTSQRDEWLMAQKEIPAL
jgi:hypothetical protein